MVSMSSHRNREIGLALVFMPRILVILVFFSLAYLAGSSALVNATRASNPAIALSMDENDSSALVMQADQRLNETAKKGKIFDSSSAAIRSLGKESINARAIRILGFSADIHNNQKLAERLNLLAHRLTRREANAQLWLLERAVQRNDLRTVLVRYDELLCTNMKLQPILFPKLAEALSDPELRHAFAPYIRKSPIWLGGFVGFALGQPNADALSSLIRQAGGLPKAEPFRVLETYLLGELFTRKMFLEAHSFYNSLPGSEPRVPITFSLSKVALDSKFSPISWTIHSNSNVGAVIEEFNNRYVIRAFALTGEAGIAASKYTFIRPGTYQFVSAQTITSKRGNGRAEWTLRCATDSDQSAFYQYDLIRNERAAAQSRQVEIPSHCTTQRIELNLVGGDDKGGTELVVTRIELN
jgi:hypothetical protein